jgi:2'-5' RNA ligase
MNKFAVDLVFLLPDEVLNKAWEINQYLDTAKIDFAQKDIYPHLSLMMGVLAEEDLDHAISILRQTGKKYSSIPLTIHKIVNKGVVSFEIKKNSALKDLHENLIQDFEPILSFDATVEMFYKPEQVKENAVDYVNEFVKKYSRENFWPHITLGFGSQVEDSLHIPFIADRLALCHLGKHCTCRNILAETHLKEKDELRR